MIAQPAPRYEAGPRYEADEGTGSGRASSRYAQLARAAAGIRVRRAGRVSVEQILLAASAVMFPLGLVFILLGWDGAAHNGHTYAQIDYLISGGLFGLGLSVAGGFMYFGYWLSRQLRESRHQNALTVQALERLEELLDATLSPRTGVAQAPVEVRLLATPRGTVLHRPDCPVVAKRSDLREVAAGTDGFGYCTMCDAAGTVGA